MKKQSAKYLGTCPVCFNKQKVRNNKMVLHGYERPGYGWINGKCYGVGYQPFELSTEGTEKYAEYLQLYVIPSAQRELDQLQAHPLWSEFQQIKQQIDQMVKDNQWWMMENERQSHTPEAALLWSQRQLADRAVHKEIVYSYRSKRGYQIDINLATRISDLRRYIDRSNLEIVNFTKEIANWVLTNICEVA